MPKFKYTDDVGRDVPLDPEEAPAVLTHVEPGEVIEASANPNPQFFEDATAKPAVKPATKEA